MSQTDDLLKLLRERGADGVTALDALREIGSFRLAARIMELRRADYDIDTEDVTLPNGKRIARYVLRESSQMALRL